MEPRDRWIHTPPRPSATFDEFAIAEIRRAAATGIYDIRGFGAKRKLPHFDDLLFLGASISRYPLEGYRERCGTDVTLGGRHAKKPITLPLASRISANSFTWLRIAPMVSSAVNEIIIGPPDWTSYPDALLGTGTAWAKTPWAAATPRPGSTR